MIIIVGIHINMVYNNAMQCERYQAQIYKQAFQYFYSLTNKAVHFITQHF